MGIPSENTTAAIEAKEGPLPVGAHRLGGSRAARSAVIPLLGSPRSSLRLYCRWLLIQPASRGSSPLQPCGTLQSPCVALYAASRASFASNRVGYRRSPAPPASPPAPPPSPPGLGIFTLCKTIYPGRRARNYPF